MTLKFSSNIWITEIKSERVLQKFLSPTQWYVDFDEIIMVMTTMMLAVI